MPHVSKNKLDQRVLKQILYFFQTIIADLKTKEEAASFLNSLLTNTEKIMLAKRLAIVILLTEGVSETEICNSLKTTYATVEKIRLMLDKKISGYQVGLKKLKKKEDWQKLKKVLIELGGRGGI